MILAEFDKHCDPKKNETVEQYKFYSRSQQSGDTFDKFLADIRILADHSLLLGNLRTVRLYTSVGV